MTVAVAVCGSVCRACSRCWCIRTLWTHAQPTQHHSTVPRTSLVHQERSSLYEVSQLVDGRSASSLLVASNDIPLKKIFFIENTDC